MIGITNIKESELFSIDKSQYGNMDDWFLVGDIQIVKV
jgi:hypothetical protein